MQEACIWSGVVFLAVFMVAWVFFARFLPPVSPSDSATEVARTFADRRNGIRTGAALIQVGCVLIIPFAAVIAAQCRTPAGRRPILAWIQVGCVVIAAVLMFMASFMWIVACFRSDRNPDVTQALVDLGFICMIMPATNIALWNVALAAAILGDTRSDPAYPRWVAYFTIWCAILYLPALAIPFFHDGLFAWNGLLAFYVPLSVFGAWILVMIWLTRDAIRRGAFEGEADRGLVQSP